MTRLGHAGGGNPSLYLFQEITRSLRARGASVERKFQNMSFPRYLTFAESLSRTRDQLNYAVPTTLQKPQVQLHRLAASGGSSVLACAHHMLRAQPLALQRLG